MSTKCSINAMDLKNFPNTNMLLKVDRFEGFSNWSIVDELVINNTSGCNCNLTITLHENSVLYYACVYYAGIISSITGGKKNQGIFW